MAPLAGMDLFFALSVERSENSVFAGLVDNDHG